MGEDFAITAGTRSLEDTTINREHMNVKPQLIRGETDANNTFQFFDVEAEKPAVSGEVALTIETKLKESSIGLSLEQLLAILPRGCALTLVRDALVASAECRIENGERRFFAAASLRNGPAIAQAPGGQKRAGGEGTIARIKRRK